MQLVALAVGLTLVTVGIGGGIAAAFLLDGMRKRIGRLEASSRFYVGKAKPKTFWNQ